MKTIPQWLLLPLMLFMLWLAFLGLVERAPTEPVVLPEEKSMNEPDARPATPKPAKSEAVGEQPEENK